ncbi:MAG: 3-isopropylmalate dehydratase/homoaconitate hydratase family large subunit [Thermoplasmata archaeon]|nr:3-isopropylmalate dehydratase/homoaconitate hydratase family large subunit [Thermoplasmata archaeon]
MLVELLSKKAGKPVSSGEFVEVDVDIMLSHENTDLVMEKFRETGKKLHSPEKIFIVLDHRAPAETESTAGLHARIRKFVKQHGIRNFHDVGSGICHEVLAESGMIFRGMFVLGTDSHTPTAGYASAIGYGVGATDMAYAWATGKIYLEVPEVHCVKLTGSPPGNVYPMDVSLQILSMLGLENEHAGLELVGDYIAGASDAAKKTLCNMLVETGAATVCAGDGKNCVDAFEVHLDEIERLVALPGNPSNVKPVVEVEGVEINQVFVGTCTSGRLEDMAILAKVLENKKVHENVRMLVAPATRKVLQDALNKGYIQTLVKAGCVILPPGCGPCLGAQMGLLADGEVCLSAGNRNYPGRMGSTNAKIYLASPYTCARSAVAGKVV